jgi:hypothetical protein
MSTSSQGYNIYLTALPVSKMFVLVDVVFLQFIAYL